MMSTRGTRTASAQGFTVIELMIATLVFSLVLILLTTGVLQFSRQYYKGVILSQTQNTARSITDDLTRAIQYNTGEVSALRETLPAGPIVGYCIGEAKRYSFALNQQVKDSGALAPNQGRHALVSDTQTGCNSNTPALNLTPAFANLTTQNARELLGENMRLAKFEITQGSNSLYTVTVKVIYGDDELLTDLTPNAGCKAQAGSQFCAISELTTTVQKRVE